ncbi:hypothetical protein D3C87_1564050 [compost metagenome]
MGDNRHKVIAHAYRLLQLQLSALQLIEQRFLLAATLFQLFNLLLHRLALAEQLDEDVDLALDRVDIQRFVQEIHGAAFVALERVIELTAGGTDKHNRNVLGLFRAAHQFGQFKAIHPGHLYVEDGHGEFVLQQKRQRLVGRLRLVHGSVFALDQRFECQQILRQIVDDQQFGLDIT